MPAHGPPIHPYPYPTHPTLPTLRRPLTQRSDAIQPVVDDYAWVQKYSHVAPGMTAFTPPVFRTTPYSTDLNAPGAYVGTAVFKE